MGTHVLKTWPEPFAAILDGSKTYEIRVNDRHFSRGDFLDLHEWNPDARAEDKYTGRRLLVEVMHITTGGKWSLPAHLCVMSIRTPRGTPDRGEG